MAFSRIEPDTSINQSPYALPTDLLQLIRVMGFNLYLYMMVVFRSIHDFGRVYYYCNKQNILALMKIGKVNVHIYLPAPIQIYYNEL